MPNAIFFHVATIGSFQRVFAEMTDAIQASGIENNLESVNLGVVGPGSISLPSSKYRIVYQNKDPGKLEFATLRELQKYGVANPSANVLYIHTKGVSTPDNPCIDDWRQYMSYFMLHKYKVCLDALEEHDIVGIDWRTDPVPHFSGNFWWSRGMYAASLPNIEELGKPNAPRVISVRHNAEFWIGMGKPREKVLWDCGINQYSRHLHRYPKEMYSN